MPMPQCYRALGFQVLPALFLVALGWGFRGLPSLVLNPARFGLIVLVLAAAATAVFLELDTNPLRITALPSRKESLQLGALALLSLALLWFLPFADRREILTFHHEAWRYVGLALCCVGAVVRLLALRSLGECFSAYVTLQPHHRLVQDGIYARIRHPLYLSLLLAPAGVALVFDSFLALPIFALGVVFVWDRIGKEERLLAARFGGEWEEYRRRSSEIIPGF